MDVLLTAFLCGLFFVSIEPVCVSVGPFNPFIFQVIIDMHDTIIIYFIILGFFFFHVYSLPSISCLENILSYLL